MMVSVTKKMMGLALLGLVLSVAALLPAMAQRSGETVLRQIEQALDQGDMETLLDWASARMEIAILEGSRNYSRGQARYVLKMFFDEHQPRRFLLRDSYRTVRGWFAEGDYWYDNTGPPLRVYLKLRMRGTEWELREILIEEKDRG